MRISDDARECSVFLGYGAPGGDPADIDAIGTGFLVTVGDAREFGIYLVTAAHVARVLGTDPFQIRHNDKNGGAALDHIDMAEWVYHPDPNVDVAVLQYAPPDWAASLMFPTKEFLNAERIRYWNIGAGDLVQIIGLFHLHSGRRRNLPIVHAGHIALEPTDEKIPVDSDTGIIEVEGYLVEISGLEGSSGSPAYVRPSTNFLQKDQARHEDTLMYAHGRVYFLGIWIGAWPGKPSPALAPRIPKGAMVPVGMGIVIPAARILELLLSPTLQDSRKRKLSEFMKHRAAKTLMKVRPKFAASLASDLAVSDKGANPDHREDFTRLVGAATKTPSQAD